MAILKQSTTYTRMFMMIDSSDHITGKTGLTVTVTLSKAGAAFAAAGATITEVSSGWYKAALTTTDTNTLGDLSYHCTATGADSTDFVDQVSAALIDDVAAYIDTEVAAIKAKTDQLTFTVANQVDSNVLDWKSSTAPAMTGDAYARLGAPAGASVSADIATVASYVDTEVAAIKAKTDQLTFTTANQVDATTVTNSDKTGYALTSGERVSVADALLDRDMSLGLDSGSTTVRTVRQALRVLRNKWAVVSGTGTVYKEDDSTASWTTTVVGTANSSPITSSDPAGP